ncbi:MAG: hypothetical protein HQ530_01225 [Parcubacteria group bacterium]|nr:hypothetical protein [Parcubacteria group bacterium]
MKGFPNQIADLGKIALGMESLISIVNQGGNAKDDGIFGQALVRTGVVGTGHIPMPIDEYIRQQLEKSVSDQSFRTTARGLRELYRLLGFIDDSNPAIEITDLGRKASSYAHMSMNSEQMDFWRMSIRNMTQIDDDGNTSHPYQVLLRLVGQKSGITRAKCALALEASDDSSDELARIVALADLPEEEIQTQIEVTKSNWDNAKKVLPAFAEQLNDVIRSGQSFTLADAPGRADVGIVEETTRQAVVRAPRTSRSVIPDTIGRAGLERISDEATPSQGIAPEAVAETNRLRHDRLHRHNIIVRELATRFTDMQLYEDPFDLLALTNDIGILVEVKTLNGTEADEVARVREALSQLLYYEAFVTTPIAGTTVVRKIACFENSISEEHREWLNQSGIAVIWKNSDAGYMGDALARATLSDFLD